jgi:lipopolysaccharide export system protein LptC
MNTLIASAAAVLLLVFLLSYSETGTPPTFSTQSSQNTLPDYYLLESNSSQFNQQGLLDFTMTSTAITHNPEHNSIDLKEPKLHLYQDGELAWLVTAHTGAIYNSGKKVDLQQRVVISSSDQEITLKTPQLTIFPDKKLAKTNKPVTLQNPNGFTRAIGLKANLETKNIDLLKQVRGQYQGVLYNNES